MCRVQGVGFRVHQRRIALEEQGDGVRVAVRRDVVHLEPPVRGGFDVPPVELVVVPRVYHVHLERVLTLSIRLLGFMVYGLWFGV